MSLENFIKEKGKEIGFDKVTIAKADVYPEHAALQEWVNQGFHGTMEYMARGIERRGNPKEIWPQARSVIITALNYNADYPYSTECVENERGWIARYAWGEDYHCIISGMLRRLEKEILQLEPGTNCKIYSDTGPLMERVFAKNSGIGWIGKNTCIIDPKLGSWLLLGVILTDLDLQPDSTISDHCGKCTACIDACPTQAIIEPYKIDARKCISYLTIEHRGPIEPELEQKIGNHIFGCDICQDVCPWNKKSPKTASDAFQPRPGFFNPNLEEFHKKVETKYPQEFKNSPLKRAKQKGLLRNIDITKKNITLNGNGPKGT